MGEKGLEPKDLYVLDKHFTTQVHPHAFTLKQNRYFRYTIHLLKASHINSCIKGKNYEGVQGGRGLF